MNSFVYGIDVFAQKGFTNSVQQFLAGGKGMTPEYL
jgi:hypothetical protein